MTSATPEVTPGMVPLGYRLFLDRVPENWQVVESKASGCATVQDLRNEFLTSTEFREKKPPFHSSTLGGDEPPKLIEEVDATQGLPRILEHIRARQGAAGLDRSSRASMLPTRVGHNEEMAPRHMIRRPCRAGREFRGDLGFEAAGASQNGDRGRT